MGKQYYCDYCQRSFRDTVQDRKRHCQSQAHCHAKIQHEFNHLERLVRRFGQQNLELLFSAEDVTRLREILAKRKGCKFHLDGVAQQTLKTVTSQCRYGLLCKNSHLLNDDQIDCCRTHFLNILSQQTTLNNLKACHHHRHCWTITMSKRQLRKELFLNIWLENRFNFNTDKRNDLIGQMLTK